MARDTLGTLVRLAGVDVDEARKILQALIAEQEQWREARRALDREIVAEAELTKTAPELAANFGTFLRQAKERRANIDAKLAELRPKVDSARDALTDAFAEQKRYELAKQAREEAEAQERARKEALALDEQGLNAHRRQNET